MDYIDEVIIDNPQDAHALLKAVYQNSEVPLPVRMRAAMACLPFETPKLLATAIVNENSFAELLDRRLKRIAEMKLIEAKPNAVEPTNENGGSVDARLPPSIPDRRFRRI
jgi:hypothetical protein